MRRSKRLCALLGILAALCGATLILLQMEERQEKIKSSGEVILEIPKSSVTALSWEYEGTALAFHKEETWLYDGDEAFPVSEEKILELLEQFQAFSAVFVIEDVEDYGQYGLDDPVCTIDISAGEQSCRMLLGDYSKMDSLRYISIGDGNVYLAQRDPMDDFDTGLKQMIEDDIIPDLDHVTEIRFTGGENYSVVYEEDSTKTYSSGDVYFILQDGTSRALDSSRVNSYLWLIRSMSLSNHVTYNASEEELHRYGMDDPDLTVTLRYTVEDGGKTGSSGVFVIHISRDAETKRLMEEAAKSEDGGEAEIPAAYVRVGESQIIYEISADRYQELMAAAYDDFRHPEVLWADFSDVRQIDISLDGAAYTLAAEESGDGRAWFYQGGELEIADIQTALESLTAEEFTVRQPTQRREIGLTIHLDNENFREVQIELYRCDGERCLAVVDGESVSLVARSGVVALMESIRAVVLQ